LAKSVFWAHIAIVVLLVLVASAGLYCLPGGRCSVAKGVVSPFPPSGFASSAVASTVSAAPVVANDSNWAGYIVASDLQNPQAVVTDVSASWVVPEVAPAPQNTFSAVWIGVGGFFDSSLIQVGTEQDWYNGAADYSAWFELLPQASTTIDALAVSPGDQMSASISLVSPSTNGWSVVITDVTGNQTFQGDFLYAASRLSAEWVVERPAIGRRFTGLATLADVGLVTFADCQATVGNVTGAISSFPAVQSVMYQTVSQNGDGAEQLAAVSDLQTDGAGFTVETSPSVVPELLGLGVLPLTLTIASFVVFAKKRLIDNRE
jgi:hypothetical protein